MTASANVEDGYPLANKPADAPLLSCQEQAIEHIRKQAVSLRPAAQETLGHILRMSDLSAASLDEVLSTIRRSARVALHFHPDRPVPGRETVSSCLLQDGVYRTQFETGISNGSVSARAGGARDKWERSLFGGAYHDHDDDDDGDDGALANRAHRPRYGALDLMRCADGPAPRFGSCYFVLRPEVSRRCTFTFGDSHADPLWKGTLDEFELVLSALFDESFMRDFALGVAGVRPPELMKRLLALADGEGTAPTSGAEEGYVSRNLDHVIEAQVHMDLHLDRDVELLVADASFTGTATGRDLEAMSQKYGFALRWRDGPCLRLEEVPTDFRGPTMPSLAARIARDGVVDAEVIGNGVRDLSADAEAWQDRGTYEEVLQEFKLLWHVLVRYGKCVASEAKVGAM